MAEFLHFSRDSRVYIEKDGRLWYIPVLDGFSFSQATNASEITLGEMEDETGRSRRGRKMFTDSLSAAEWSFSSYARPFKAKGGLTASSSTAQDQGRADVAQYHHAVEEVLWVAMAGVNVYDPDAFAFKHGTDGGAISSFTETTNTLSGTTDGTYVLNIDSENESSGVVTSGSGRNATISVTLASDVATVTVTERGTKYSTGDTVTITGNTVTGTGSGTLVLTLTSESFTSDGTDLNINFYDSNRSSLGEFTLYFLFSAGNDGRLLYKLPNAVVNEASFDFDIDGIAMINWSGFAGQIIDLTSASLAANVTAGVQAVMAEATTPTDRADASALEQYDLWIDTDDDDKLYIYDGVNDWIPVISEGTTETANFIRNRLTQLALAPDATFLAALPAGTYQSSYSIPITGGNVTVSNNITYLTPEELGLVNQPFRAVAGTRSVTGNFTMYLGSSDVATNRAKDLFEDLVSDTARVINKFDLKFSVGGTTSGALNAPGIELRIPLAHLEIPSHSIEDVISLEGNFHGQGTTIGEADEILLTYKGPQLV